MGSTVRAGVHLLALTVALAGWTAILDGQAPGDEPVEYLLSFPEPHHRWLQVEAVFAGLGEHPLRIRMSSASPGRYARHEFAKNIIDIEAFGADDQVLALGRPATQVWSVAEHGGTVRVRYRLFGDRVDGTYLGVDATHGHLNLPATLLWAEGLEERPVTVAFEPPPAAGWRVATQLFPTTDPMVFTAPNLQYLLDSPTELSDFALREFSVSDPADTSHRPRFRVAVHHEGQSDGVDAFAASVRAVVEEMVLVFGEFPRFDTGTYTFIADYLSGASRDAMEHRNSTVLTAASGLDTAGERAGLLQAVSHEFFHAWNVERIRPRSLEPFDFADANVSGELWFAEGFTNYYGKLVALRAGVADLPGTLASFETALNTVILAPGRRLRSAVEMSRMAPFVDAATAIDRTNFDNTFVSYYTWGEVIALGLDLTLRHRSDGATTLDDYMRALWRRYGVPEGPAPGVVGRPFVPSELRSVLGEVTGDQAFADAFFERFIDGHDVVDAPELFARAGLVLRRVAAGRPTLGRVRLGTGLLVTGPTPYGSPLYQAGVDRGDVLTSLDGRPVRSGRDLAQVLAGRRPGDTLSIGFERGGEPITSTVTVGEDPLVELRTLESIGEQPSPEQLDFRVRWLGSQG